MKVKMLIVDDDAKSITLLEDLLRLRNIEVLKASNGRDALALLTPELKCCFIDIRLPDMSGSVVARRIREKYAAMCLVAYTASVLSNEKDELIRSNLFDAVLLKPLKLEEFEKVMTALE
ncbi:MAG: hypothetical protein A2219_01070 [Elusimicrobia bacterium RIFOXYA2_FULL_50_26]|nr:MAG: hypothetical protein A2219_01070 [Elusimicrobia bacterium RIFOXYA2_FULL_50_26]OGS23429.1 MAG: hypothetical protein A2314_00600 [Elusimicrobia bacterium RIFOXYB2_FULL_50_12]